MILAFLLFGSVIYDRAVIYKHDQEIKAYSILTKQTLATISAMDDFSLVKSYLSKNILLKNQLAHMLALLDAYRNIEFRYKNNNINSHVIKNIIQNIKNSNTALEGKIKVEDLPYYWHLNKINNSYSLLSVYPLSAVTIEEFFNFFGAPYIIYGIIFCWLMIWLSFFFSSLVTKLQLQKNLMSEQAKEIEKTRDQAIRKNLTKSEFLANMSHEIRTPLTSILGFAEICLDSDQSMLTRSKAIKTIIKSGQYILLLVNEILDLSKIEAGKLVIEKIPFSIINVLSDVEQIISIKAKEKGLVFRMNFDFPIPETVISDPVRVEQILLNICSNAIKFTERGTVSLHVSYQNEASKLVFKIMDAGIGISKDQQEKIFKPFEQAELSTTRKFGGTGLGLSLSKKIAKIIDGDIFVDSVLGKGSCFTFSLNVGDTENIHYIYEYTDNVAEDKLLDTNIEAPLLSGKVLLVEDNSDIQALVKILLTKTGVKVDVVNNGLEAIKAVDEKKYDLVFMDIEMPVMNGMVAMEKLQDKGYNIPVIVMSANAMDTDRELYQSVGFSDFIAKPIDRHNLYEVVTKYLELRKSEGRKLVMLTSNLIKDEPGLIDLIEKFMVRLPAFQEKINLAYKEKNIEEFSSLLHQLKGVGGGYGYPMLTEICAKVEFQVVNNDDVNIKKLMQEFDDMVEQILAGREENRKIAEQACP